jgi:phospholipase/carboxylesterase
VSEPTRRQFLLASGRLAFAGLLAGCGTRQRDGFLRNDRRDGEAALSARPGAGVIDPSLEWLSGPGTHPLGLEETRDPVLYVPQGTVAGQAAPLILTLHGAGGDAESGLAILGPLADERAFVLLAPASRGTTWDALRDDYGPDTALIDRALELTFSAIRVDPERVAVAGFSDGASYALGLGLANGGLFGRIIAFSPGFIPPAAREGMPAVFISHGDADRVLPVDRTSGRIVPRLRRDGYDVTYREFDGPHTVPAEVVREAVNWLDWKASP